MFGRFGENKSSTSITYKKYEETPEDKYPTFSICFKGANVHSYNKSAIFESYGITSSHYQLLLEGKSTFTYRYNSTLRFDRKSSNVVKKASRLKFEGMMQRTFEMADILLEANFTRQDEAYNTYYSRNLEETPTFYISHEMPQIICFTRTSQNISKSPRAYDTLVLNHTAFDPDSLPKSLFEDTIIQIFIHYPGQLMRSLVKPSFSYPIFNYYGMTIGNHLHFKLYQSTVIRYRRDSNEPCNEEIEDYDAYMQEYITKETGCIHPFWKKNCKGLLKYGECQSPEQFKSFGRRLKSYNKKSCVKMVKSASWNWEGKNNWRDKAQMIFEYIDDEYQEIEYLISFGAESLISNLGGFIGIFLGCSLMRLPELLGRCKQFCIFHICC